MSVVFHDPKIAAINAEVEEVKEKMHNNIKKLSDNLESLEILESKTQVMQELSKTFQKNATSLKRKEWWKNMKLNMIIGGSAVGVTATVGGVIALIIIL